MLLVGAQRKVDVLCLREHETTLVESMYRLMEIIIGKVPSFERHYVVRHNHILGVNGTQIRFRGLSESTGTARGVKSLEGIDICVLEEAAYLSARRPEHPDPDHSEGGIDHVRPLQPAPA